MWQKTGAKERTAILSAQVVSVLVAVSVQYVGGGGAKKQMGFLVGDLMSKAICTHVLHSVYDLCENTPTCAGWRSFSTAS